MPTPGHPGYQTRAMPSPHMPHMPPMNTPSPNMMPSYVQSPTPPAAQQRYASLAPPPPHHAFAPPGHLPMLQSQPGAYPHAPPMQAQGSYRAMAGSPGNHPPSMLPGVPHAGSPQYGMRSQPGHPGQPPSRPMVERGLASQMGGRDKMMMLNDVQELPPSTREFGKGVVV
jgi:hypothetical protein